MLKSCPTCGNSYDKPTKYCCASCYHKAPVSAETRARISVAGTGLKRSADTKARISAATRGKPKPWQRGSDNPNYGGTTQTAEVRVRMAAARKAVGSTWTAAQRAEHSRVMRGSVNAMRGTKHTDAARAAMSAAKKQQYSDGVVNIRRYKLSAAEKQIAVWLRAQHILFTAQFHIKGVPFLYDFYVHDMHLLVEYQGDYWHANPRKYAAGSTVRLWSRGHVPVETIWARDAAKRRAAEAAGYRVAYLWEMDFLRLGVLAVAAVLDAGGYLPKS